MKQRTKPNKNVGKNEPSAAELLFLSVLVLRWLRKWSQYRFKNDVQNALEEDTEERREKTDKTEETKKTTPLQWNSCLWSVLLLTLARPVVAAGVVDPAAPLQGSRGFACCVMEGGHEGMKAF